jgi:peptidoglycan hydrolase-like protein with peptidoglycan-binding domain
MIFRSCSTEADVKMLAVAIVAAVSLSAIATLPTAAQQPPTGRDITQLNMAAVPNLDRDSVRIVQRALENKGFDPGPIDGRVGPRTRQAVRGFQYRYGMKASGEINNQVLFALGKVDMATQARGH